ncbi:peptidoglycan-binding domain-containing protein [Shimia sp. MMG029]|uniref:peptidoglycan-binding domain-containing protein n=1 Tax=Shimia sp. MMG029 TaxID=3021978 RepID=UPI0022FE375E|nr:peptidoglycan-binding domain-containing protein [Shimia sp. MMG029]MDA5557269.1 peptidoglycan-binding domain-containing protein [Shimia sp. MMG029]
MVRSTLFALSFSALAAFSVSEAYASATGGLSNKERYAQAEALRLGTGASQDSASAFALMSDLARDGDSRAQARLAYYYLKGIGVDADPAAAAVWYEAAIDAGRDSARTSYAKLLAAQGAGDAALAQLDKASEAGLEKAQVLRATYHYQGKFGSASDADFGQAQLTDFATSGNMAAMQVVLAAMQKGASFDVDADLMTAQMLAFAREDQAKSGGKAAEALLRLWREQTDAQSIALRTELVAHPSLRMRAKAEEGLLLAHATHDPRAFRGAAEEIIAQTSGADFNRAVYVVSRLDKNAYVHVLQEELKRRGYAVGPTTGIFNTRTMWAVVEFCQDTGIQAECRLGPLRAKVIKVIVGELAEMTPGA